MIKTEIKLCFASIFTYCSLVCCASLLFTACSDNEEPAVETEGEWDSPLRGSIATDETADCPATILGNVPVDMKEALNHRFTHLSSTVSEGTDVLFVSSSELSGYKEEIAAVYENDGIIIIIKPDTPVVNNWFGQMGLDYELVDDGVEKELYAFSKCHQYILDAADESTTINEHLNYFISWINQTLSVSLVLPPEAGETAIDKLTSAQTITHTFNYDLEITEAKVALSKADKIYGKGVFTAKYSIYALYAFQDQPTAGDFYIVSAEYTAHNSDMCPVDANDHRWTSKHGGVYCRLCGFYMTNFNVETVLTKSDKETKVGEYLANYSPTPLTTQGSTSYSSGMSWSLGGEVAVGGNAAGPNGSVTVTGGVTFSNSQSRTISDVEILNQSTSNVTKYEYKVNNLPYYQVGSISISVPPLVSVSNATLYSSWIWRVPSTTEQSTEKFFIGTKPTITYGSCHFYSSGADFKSHKNSPKMDEMQYAQVTPPNRIPTGLLKITNTNGGEYISDVVITNEKGEVEYTSSGKGSVAYDDSFLRYIPTGTYTVEFKMGANVQSTKTYVLSEKITIRRGEEITLNSAFDFEEKSE